MRLETQDYVSANSLSKHLSLLFLFQFTELYMQFLKQQQIRFTPLEKQKTKNICYLSRNQTVAVKDQLLAEAGG